jgi:hypothetical protein
MNKLLLTLMTTCLTVSLVSGCANTPRNTEIHGYDGPRILSQENVIFKTRNCIDAGMKAVVVYVPQRYPTGSIDVPVDVNCYPSWNMK